MTTHWRRLRGTWFRLFGVVYRLRPTAAFLADKADVRMVRIDLADVDARPETVLVRTGLDGPRWMLGYADRVRS